MKSRPGLTVSAITACVLLITGCGTSDENAGPGDKKTETAMNMQEAAEQADSMLDATFSAIKPEIEWAHGPTTAGSCDLSRRRAVMTVISEERRGSFLGVVERSWRSRGYHITNVNKSKEFPAVFAKTSDGFGIILTIGGGGQAFFEVATPCVRESKVADPTSKPKGPTYEGIYPLPRPNVRSAFWSSSRPPQ
ncbi:hypothetical protein [Streptomyces sp. NRRL S-1521]|uniref:hypothetical protein n=1 Tax=Streptomyces sp. NRRL S-1521 TaxID=1609100 RepID=UPI0018FE66F7|nr:hypothetical protein [Streptomyces sp. NRRL S-1521]